MRFKDAVLRHSLNLDPYNFTSRSTHNVSLIITEKAITTVFHHPGSYTPTFNTHMTTQTCDSFGRNKWMFLDTMELLIAERQATRRIRQSILRTTALRVSVHCLSLDRKDGL